jgi:hypothetical protein
MFVFKTAGEPVCMCLLSNQATAGTSSGCCTSHGAAVADSMRLQSQWHWKVQSSDEYTRRVHFPFMREYLWEVC